MKKIFIVFNIILFIYIGLSSYFIIKQSININNLESEIKRQNINIIEIQDLNKTLKFKIKYLRYIEYFKHNNEEPVILPGTSAYSYWESILFLENNLINEKTKSK